VAVFKQYTVQSVIPNGICAEKAIPVLEILGERAKSAIEFESIVMPDKAFVEAVSRVMIAFKVGNNKRMRRKLPTFNCIKASYRYESEHIQTRHCSVSGSK